MWDRASEVWRDEADLDCFWIFLIFNFDFGFWKITPLYAHKYIHKLTDKVMWFLFYTWRHLRVKEWGTQSVIGVTTIFDNINWEPRLEFEFWCLMFVFEIKLNMLSDRETWLLFYTRRHWRVWEWGTLSVTGDREPLVIILRWLLIFDNINWEPRLEA